MGRRRWTRISIALFVIAALLTVAAYVLGSLITLLLIRGRQ